MTSDRDGAEPSATPPRQSHPAPQPSPAPAQAEPASTELRQAEPYGGPASGGKRLDDPYDDPSARSVRAAIIGGLAMLGTSLVASLMGVPPWISFLLGLGVFVAVVAWRRANAGGGLAGGLLGGSAPLTVDRAAAKAAGLDPDAADARLAAAAARLGHMDQLAAGLGDPALERRIRAMTAEARKTLHALAADPSDIDMARKFLITTIPSAEASVEKYAGLGVRDAALSERFGALMGEVADAATRQREALRRDDALALEVEMEVLAERLRQS